MWALGHTIRLILPTEGFRSWGRLNRGTQESQVRDDVCVAQAEGGQEDMQKWDGRHRCIVRKKRGENGRRYFVLKHLC